ncbi:16S rRNA (cytidine(1402)-2'-O)-methyltransferase [Ructibacterium gallinarum]|uniref:Ribosomal RNA small subunit methyltransferase I n=1 Tax=Ructibacterium gallinarum TaxID=2779355 RepID=A0A9D5M542_9FIRM|nr:16S rRNA (cytidine(1402)-2'-O)-methyltransferase [Ructibacterium gallinarum]MBE5039694.1 16S rRNA (cytidine(1402)-2'-O)-methyltransferase [Ructibacterium gallinarum]
MNGKLYLCATPIGNLEDITLRTLRQLQSVDLIAAEDTRVSKKLLLHFGIQVPVTSYYEHNKREKGNYLLEKLKNGMQIAVITDAGMPGISDPGEDLVRLCAREQIPVEVLPGPCAFATALVGSGLPTGRFAFEGFLTVNKKNRMEHLNSLKTDTRTLIFYEAPHKLLTTLRDMYMVFGNRRLTLARELTKRFEEYRRTDLSDAITYYETNPPKGEFVLVLAGADPKEVHQLSIADLPSAEELIRKYAAEGMRAKELTKQVADTLHQPRREIYELYLRLKDELGEISRCTGDK